MKAEKKPRIWELDFARGLAIVLMFVVHYNYAAYAAAGMTGIYDAHPLYAFSRMCRDFYLSDAGKTLQMLCGVLFAVLSGVTSSFSSPGRCLYKGVKYLLLAMILTAVTSLASAVTAARLTIVFGVLHMLSVSMLLYTALSLLLSVLRAPGFVRSMVPAVLGVALIGVALLVDLKSIDVSTHWLMPLGIPGRGFFSSDYYPLLPWTGVFLLGAAAGRTLYPDRRSLLRDCPCLTPDRRSLLPRLAAKKRNRPLCALGRFSIQFYLVHQVALIGFFCLLYLVFS